MCSSGYRACEVSKKGRIAQYSTKKGSVVQQIGEIVIVIKYGIVYHYVMAKRVLLD